ncbi:MAG: SPASM domain-containing protein [Candidatus Diapherotrites archaeon]|nr:SPASM domain-containing protein [Candidatus Diapherotrites archaeon]
MLTRAMKFVGRKMVKYAPFESTSRLLSMVPDSILYANAPLVLAVEPTSRCNLKCPLCLRETMTRETGNMSFETFKNLVDGLPRKTETIELFGQGEPFMCPDLFKMIKYAEGKGIKVKISSNTTIIDKFLPQIFESGLSHLIVVLDGATAQAHEFYRIGSNFNTTVENIQKICAYKKENGFDKPIITLQTLVMKSNEHQLADIVKMAREFGVDHMIFKTISIGAYKDIKEKLAKQSIFLPESRQFIRSVHENKKSICYWAWGTNILWNGDVSSCCYDGDGKHVVGNVNEKPFKEIWRSPEYQKMRRQILRQELDICQTCSYSSEININVF